MIQQPDKPDLKDRAGSSSRRLRLWAVLLALVLACGGLYLFVETVKTTLWIGSRDVELQFVVVDKGTGQPIEGATISLYGGYESDPPLTLHTGLDGTAKKVVTCRSGGRETLFTSSSHVSFGNWGLEITKDGYRGTGRLELAQFTGESRDGDDATPPPIRVELKRLPAAGEG
jgi:hypothetical protein